MSCNCKHHEDDINHNKRCLEQFKELFIKRMTEDSETNDRRRRDYNQAIFSYDEYRKEYTQAWSEITLYMVLQCFDDAVKDYRRTYCDVKNCNRK